VDAELVAVDEEEPGAKWAALFERFAPAYRRWFLRQGDAARPSYRACRRALREHLPELVPTYERLVDLAGGGDLAARLLSLYRPTPYVFGCSQAVFGRGHDPILVRNYDYAPALWEGVLLRSRWSDRATIAMSDCLWGVLDGINEEGLCVALSFGGRRVVGDGFGIPLVLRYVLERCRTAGEAAAALERIPSHMAYNVTLLDAAGERRTVQVAPDRPASVTRRPVATNHQRRGEWKRYVHATASVDREAHLYRHLEDPDEREDRFVARFLEPPLYTTDHARGFGTLYTAVYRPRGARAETRWPRYVLPQAIDRFREVTLRIRFPSRPRGSAGDPPHRTRSALHCGRRDPADRD